MSDNHTIRNISHMLAYAFEALRKDDWDTLAAEDFEHIHDLLAAILVYGIPIQIKRGLHRDYLRQEGGIAGVRGLRPCGSRPCRGADSYVPTTNSSRIRRITAS